MKISGTTCFKMKTHSDDAEPAWSYNVISDPENWRVVKIKVVSPGRASRLLGEDMARHGILLIQDGEPASLLRHSASEGFPKMNRFFLGMLAKHLGLPWSGTVREIVARLLEHICADMDEDRRMDIIDGRSVAACPVEEEDALHSNIMNPEVRDMISNLVDDDDREEIKHLACVYTARKADAAAKAQRQRRVAASAGPAPAPIADIGAEAPASLSSRPPLAAAPARSRHPIPGGPNAPTPSEAKALIPPLAGCRIFRETAIYYTRWIVSYPTDRPPRSCSKGWLTTGLTERQALLACLQWCWARHAEMTGEACPHDLSE